STGIGPRSRLHGRKQIVKKVLSGFDVARLLAFRKGATHWLFGKIETIVSKRNIKIRRQRTGVQCRLELLDALIYPPSQLAIQRSVWRQPFVSIIAPFYVCAMVNLS